MKAALLMYANLDGDGILLTGDAGVEALNSSIDYAELLDVDLQRVVLYRYLIMVIDIMLRHLY